MICTKKGPATSTIHNAHVPLSQALDQAVKNELIYNNPCRNTVMPKRPPRQSRVLTVEEQERFINILTDLTFGSLFSFAVNTGMRCGEIMALTWGDVDFEKKTVMVNKTASVIVDRDEDRERSQKTIIDSTKTESGNRSIPLTKSALETLKTQQKKPHCATFIFASKSGTILIYRNINRAFCEFKAKAELPDDIKIHSLRHTFATRLLEKGANVKVISELLGHASVQITLDIYSHVFPSLKRETIDLLEQGE